MDNEHGLPRATKLQQPGLDREPAFSVVLSTRDEERRHVVEDDDFGIAYDFVDSRLSFLGCEVWEAQFVQVGRQKAEIALLWQLAIRGGNNRFHAFTQTDGRHLAIDVEHATALCRFPSEKRASG